MLLDIFTLAALAATIQLAFASPTSLVRRTNPNEPPPVVDLGYARYQGFFNDTTELYEWRAGEQSEDCLFLNVQAPPRALKGGKLPVLVWIHGGGYGIGDSSTTSDLSDFIRLGGSSFVTVRISYRLGAFGFLAGEAVKKHGVLNAGLLDQQFALRWIQQHVSKFGGDPGHIAVWGVSAGAGSILNHLVANGGETSKALGLNKPLFQAALTSSVFLPPQVDYNAPSVEKVYARLASAVNCTDIASSFACLAKVDAARLAAAAFANAAAAPWAVWTYVPVTDGSFLRDRASVLLSQGRAKLNGMFLTAINNADEGAIWADPTLAADSTTDPTALASQFDRLLSGLFPQLNASDRQTVAEYYSISPAHPVGNTAARISAVIADSTFNCPSYWLAEAFGSSAHKGTFAISPASHGWNTFYYLGDIFGGNRSRSSVESFDGALAGAILGSFDPNKNPANPHLNPYWPTFNTHKELVFNTTTTKPGSPAGSHVVKTSSLKRFGKDQLERCEVWRGPISQNAGLYLFDGALHSNI
ncbi:hypothetical protein JCM10296v2_001491 [Rhodotorula toruloides]